MKKLLGWSMVILTSTVLMGCVDHVIDRNPEPPVAEIVEPGADFILPKHVTVSAFKGTVTPGFQMRDTLEFEYEYTTAKRVSIIKRSWRGFEIRDGITTQKMEIRDRVEFSYQDSIVEMKIYDEKDNNNLVQRIRFKFSNSVFAYPDYSAVQDGKSMTSFKFGYPYGPFDSLVYSYTEDNFLKNIHQFNDGELQGNFEFRTTPQTINPAFRGYIYSQTPASLNQYCGYYFPDYFGLNLGGQYGYPLGLVDPLAFPIKMFKSSEFLAEQGGAEVGAFTYTISNGRVDFMRYYSSTFDGAGSDFIFSY